jgi:hypothetical protein
MMGPMGCKENGKQRGMVVGSKREGNAIVVKLRYNEYVLPTTIYYVLPRKSKILYLQSFTDFLIIRKPHHAAVYHILQPHHSSSVGLPHVW